MKLKNNKSLLQGQTSMDEAKSILSVSKLSKTILKSHIGDALNIDYDTVVCEGDLVIDGNFDLSDNDICNLIVKGNFTVNGLLEHYDDPETFIFVGGNLHVQSMVTGGTLEVMGNTVVENALVGFYNDYSAELHGNIRAAFFYPEEHSFDIDGAMEFGQLWGSSYRLNDNKHKLKFGETYSREFYNLINHAALEEPVSEEDAEEMSEVGDYFDYLSTEKLASLLREGKSIFKS